MYGMVNQAFEDMIIERFGDECWDRIKAAARVEVDVFISNEGYPDELTYQLVGAASTLLELPAAELLEAFGVHWILQTAREGYGELMAASGRTLEEFLRNLPNFHTRVSLIFPHLQPPRFVCTDQTETSLRLHYYSQRPDLTPFVRGLLRGLGDMFATPLSITQEAARADGADHDIFDLAWERPIAP